MMHQIAGIVLAGGKSSRFGSDKGLFPYQGKPLAEHAIDILRPNLPHLIISTNNPDAYAYLNLPMVADTYPGCGPIGGIYSALAIAANQQQTNPSSSILLNSSTPRLLNTTTQRFNNSTIQQPLNSSSLKLLNPFPPQQLNNSTIQQLNKVTVLSKRCNNKLTNHLDPKGTSIAIISCDTPHVPPELFAFLKENLGSHDAVVPVHEGFKETTCAIYTTGCLPYLEQAIKHKRYKILDALEEANTLFLDVTTADFYKPGMFHNINYRTDLNCW